MRSIEDKGCMNYIPKEEISSSSENNFDFHKGNGANRGINHRTGLGKPTPSKWDDAQKWIVNLSRGGDRNPLKTKPRNSNADDRRLIAPVPKEDDYYPNGDENEENSVHFEVETKNIDCEESVWRVNQMSKNSDTVIRSICVRDMGTEMTPIASQEPSRTGTPIRVRSPLAKSPVSSPVRNLNEVQSNTNKNDGNFVRSNENRNLEEAKKMSPLESRALAWDEAERAKYTARFKREEVKIQAWENHEMRKAEMEMKRIEVKAERLKSRAQEKFTNKLAATKRIAEEKRANAEAKLNEKAVRTSERADYIRRTGHLPSKFSFKTSSGLLCVASYQTLACGHLFFHLTPLFIVNFLFPFTCLLFV